MKSLGIFFVKVLLPIGAGWLLWQGAQRSFVSKSRYELRASSTIESVQPIRKKEHELTAAELIVPRGTEINSPVEQKHQPSTSPKDVATSLVTLGWGARITETP